MAVTKVADCDNTVGCSSSVRLHGSTEFPPRWVVLEVKNMIPVGVYHRLMFCSWACVTEWASGQQEL